MDVEISSSSPSTCQSETTSSLFQYKNLIPPESDKALIDLLSSTDWHIKFNLVCQRKPQHFGYPGLELRKQGQNRRNYIVHCLQEDPCYLAALKSSISLTEDKEAARKATPTQKCPVDKNACR